MNYVKLDFSELDSMVGKWLLIRGYRATVRGTIKKIQGDFYLENKRGLYSVTEFLEPGSTTLWVSR